MSKNRRSIMIDAPVEKVFAFAADFENDPRWRSEVERMRYTTGRPVGVGSQAVETARILGQTLNTTTVITDYEPNRRVAAESISGRVPIVSSRDFEAVQDGTRFTYTLEGDVSGVPLFRLIQPILTRWYQKRLEGYLRTLKQALESEPAAAAGGSSVTPRPKARHTYPPEKKGKTMTTTFKTLAQASWTTAFAVALAALFLALMGTALAKPAGATFPGQNGKIAFASDRTTGEGVTNPEGDFEIFTMNRDGTGLTQLTENAALDFDPEWSPDGEKIAFTSDRDLFSNIFLMNADGSKQTRITKGEAFDRSPTFSPNGKRIAFDSNLEAGEGVDNPEGEFEIFSVRVDGTGLTQLTKNAATDFQPDYSPDGKKIAFVSRRNFAPGIYTMNPDGTKQRKVSRGPAVVFQSPSWSPDGARIAFVSDEDGPLNIYTMDGDGKRQRQLTDNSVQTEGGPVFSPNGRKIAFQTNRDGNFEIYKMRADGTRPVNLTNDPAGDFTPDWQPLEKRR